MTRDIGETVQTIGCEVVRSALAVQGQIHQTTRHGIQGRRLDRQRQAIRCPFFLRKDNQEKRKERDRDDRGNEETLL